MPAPEVSVVIPAFNAEKTIGETLASVLGQTFEDWELVVVDDGSRDGTAAVVHAIDDERIKLVSIANGGVARARNRGIADARGEMVALLDADDVWLPTKLERQVALMKTRPDLGMCFTAATRVSSDTGRTSEMPARDYADFCEALLLYSVIVPAACSSIVARRRLVIQAGGFDPAFSQTADWDFCLRMSRLTPFASVPEALVRYRTHPGNMSSDISLLERDTFAVLDKVFADPKFAQYLPLRARIYSNHWMICSGSYLHARHYASAARCLTRGLQTYPPNVRGPLGLPKRWFGRLARSTAELG